MGETPLVVSGPLGRAATDYIGRQLPLLPRRPPRPPVASAFSVGGPPERARRGRVILGALKGLGVEVASLG